MLAHWVGIIGEGLNFFGAVVIALDIFLRQNERAVESSLHKLNLLAMNKLTSRTTYYGIPLNAPDFAKKVLDKKAIRLAYVGVGLLVAGFLCLVGYHGIEIYEIK